MRIITGSLGGRVFDSPHSECTHPMSDKMRGALFNILGDIEGLTVLDPFAGTGALCFEAVSRGAMSAVAIESDNDAQRTIIQNIKALGLQQQVMLVGATADVWDTTTPTSVFDLVLCDPPYHDLQLDLLAKLASRVRPQTGIFALSFPARADVPEFAGLTQIMSRTYGVSQLIFYRAD